MNGKRSDNHISTVAVLAVFLVLIFCVVTVLVSGAGVYRRIVRRTAASNAERVFGQYFFQKVQAAGSPDRVTTEPFGSGKALVIGETLGGGEYRTYLYTDGIKLREVFVPEGTVPEFGSGEEIMETGPLGFIVEDGLLTVASEKWTPLFINLTGGSAE